MDPLIRLFREKPEALELLGRVWEILYVEGSTPDIGKRREGFIRMLLEKEFGLEVAPAPSMEREWDFRVTIEGEERTLKKRWEMTCGGYRGEGPIQEDLVSIKEL